MKNAPYEQIQTDTPSIKVQSIVLDSDTENGSVPFDDHVSFETMGEAANKKTVPTKVIYDYDTALRIESVREFYDGAVSHSKKRNGPLPEIRKNSTIMESPCRTQAASAFSPRDSDI